MTNEDLYRTARGRSEAFEKFCSERDCHDCKLSNNITDCRFLWLEMKCEELLSCPCCGGKVVVDYFTNCRRVRCMNTGECGYACAKKKSAEEAIAAHNRMARAVNAAKKGEE